MWQLYCLPGLIIARFAFLFPGRRTGDITGTRRRNESGCARFLFATLFWVAIGLYAIGYFSGPKSSARSSAQTALIEQDAGTPNDQSRQPIVYESAMPLEAEVAEPGVAATTTVPAKSAEADESTILADPRSIANLDRAIDEAVRTGMATKWKVGKLKGYAVPSAPNAVGCRAVSVSISNRDNARTGNVTVCPSDAAQ